MTYPCIRAVLAIMANDQGLDMENHPWMKVEKLMGLRIHTERYVGSIDLELLEECFAKLDLADLEELVIGDEEEWPRIMSSMTSDDKTQEMIHAFLEEAFAQCGGFSHGGL